MAEATEASVAKCSCPGCDQPGTSVCASCLQFSYCCRTCQTADWSRHKEECPGHLLKMGMAHLSKASGFYRELNFLQTFRYSELALTKLNLLTKRPLQSISDALTMKCNALQFLGRNKEALQCSKDLYNLWAVAEGPTHQSTIDAAFALIESCILNKEYESAELYARTLWEIINHKHDNKIPEDQRQRYIANGAREFARATYRLSKAGGFGTSPEAKQRAKDTAITHARKAIEIHTELRGAESSDVAGDLVILADILRYFNNGMVEDEVLNLYAQAKAIFIRMQGADGVNVAAADKNLGNAYYERAKKAMALNDGERCVVNMELALPCYREAVRIYTLNNHLEKAAEARRNIVQIEASLPILATRRSTTTEISAARK